MDLPSTLGGNNVTFDLELIGSIVIKVHSKRPMVHEFETLGIIYARFKH